MSVNKKRGGGSVSPRNKEGLRMMIVNYSLVDLGFSEYPFTWTNLRLGVACIMERFDQGFENQNFVQQFDRTTVVHLTWTRSDHNTLLIKEHTESIRSTISLPFKMLHAWFPHQGFTELLKDSWGSGLPALEVMEHFKQEAQEWNRFIFCNNFVRKQQCQATLNGIQKARAGREFELLYKLEKELLAEMDSILEKEDLVWY